MKQVCLQKFKHVRPVGTCSLSGLCCELTALEQPLLMRLKEGASAATAGQGGDTGGALPRSCQGSASPLAATRGTGSVLGDLIGSWTLPGFVGKETTFQFKAISLASQGCS